MGTQTIYFEMTLHVGIAFRVDYSLMDYFKMNSHANITYKLWFSLKGHPNYIVVILKWPYMWVSHLGLVYTLGYLNHLKVILKRTWIWVLHLKKHKKKVCILPFGNISKFYLYIYIYIYIYNDIALFYICWNFKFFAQNAP